MKNETTPPQQTLMDTPWTHPLFLQDWSGLAPGALNAADAGFSHLPDGFRIVARGLGQYLEARDASASCGRMAIAGDSRWREYNVRAVMTPLGFDDPAPGALGCGVAICIQDSANYLALILDEDWKFKLLDVRNGVPVILAEKQLEFCIGQHLTLTLGVLKGRVYASALPYTGMVKLECPLPRNLIGGRVGLLTDSPARFGPVNVECANSSAPTEALAVLPARKNIPQMKITARVPLHGLASGRNLVLADLNGDGKPEIVAAQHSSAAAAKYSMTRLTCLTALDMNGAQLWQAGIADTELESAPVAEIEEPALPFRVYDLFGGGPPAVINVFGYDVQLRDGKTGRVLRGMSGGTPETHAVPAEMKQLSPKGGGSWGDETLNMDAGLIDFCDTQGGGGRRELITHDGARHFAVQDPLAEPFLKTVFRARGNFGRALLVSDIDGDGRDEILAGFSLWNYDGTPLWSYPSGEIATDALIVESTSVDSEAVRKRIVIAMENPACPRDGGLLFVHPENMLNKVSAQKRHTPGEALFKFPVMTVRCGPVSQIRAVRLRGVDGAPQIAAAGALHSDAALIRLFDATGKQLWSREIAGARPRIHALRRGGQLSELLLVETSSGYVLLDGEGQTVGEQVFEGGPRYLDVNREFFGGRDAILAWDRKELWVMTAE